MGPGNSPETLVVGGRMVIWDMYICLGYNDTWICKITDSKRQGNQLLKIGLSLKFVTFWKGVQCIAISISNKELNSPFYFGAHLTSPASIKRVLLNCLTFDMLLINEQGICKRPCLTKGEYCIKEQEGNQPIFWTFWSLHSSPKSCFASQLACSFRDSQDGEWWLAESEIFIVTKLIIIEIAIVCYLTSCILSFSFSSLLSPRLGPINLFKSLVKGFFGPYTHAV